MCVMRLTHRRLNSEWKMLQHILFMCVLCIVWCCVYRCKCNIALDGIGMHESHLIRLLFCSVWFESVFLWCSLALCSPHPQEDCVIYCAEIINYFVCLFAECTTMCLGVTKDTVCRFKMLRLYDLWTIERYFTILWTSICFRAGRRKLWPQVQIVTHVIRQS